MINSVTICGNLTKDSELKSSNSGAAILDFSVAVSDRRKNKQTGEWEDVPMFFDCTMFGTRAEKLADYLLKGTRVTVNGKLRYSSWEKDGQRRSKVDIIADEIEFMSRREQHHVPQPNYGPMPNMPIAGQDSGPYNAPQNVYQAPQQVQSMVNNAFQQKPQVPDMYDEEIPFD